MSEAGGEGGMGGWCDGLGGDVKLGVVGIAVELESILTEDLTKWEDVDNEEEGTED